MSFSLSPARLQIRGALLHPVTGSPRFASPCDLRAHDSVRAEARCRKPKNFQIRPLAENATASPAIYDPQKQKSPTDPRGPFGLPSQSQTSNIDGPAKLQEFMQLSKTNHLSVGIATAHLRG
jgi:hypothetical protein